MTRTRTITIGVIGILVLLLLVYGFWPTATTVTTATAQRDSMRVTVEEEGQTQLRERYVVSAPTTGYLKRVSTEAGDVVQQGEVLARLARLPAKMLDEKGYRAAEAKVQSAQAALQRAQEETVSAKAARTYAREEYRRIQRLKKKGTASQQQLDRARTEYQKAKAQHQAAKQSVEQARGELRAAKSRLGLNDSGSNPLPSRTMVRAPANGQILQVHKKSAGVVQAGTPLVMVGHPDSLEVSVDVLSSDAVRITKGTPVTLVRWGGEHPLEGRVRVVPPQGHTQVSALGVEEQRVEVLVDLIGPPSQWERLGTGYRVVSKFVTWAGGNVLQVPQSALFRHNGGWAVFAVRDGRAERKPVEVGHRSGLQAQITDGLSEGTRVVTHPDEQLSDGTRVEER
jgi:HlyD family secretion protein